MRMTRLILALSMAAAGCTDDGIDLGSYTLGGQRYEARGTAQDGDPKVTVQGGNETISTDGSDVRWETVKRW